MEHKYIDIPQSELVGCQDFPDRCGHGLIEERQHSQPIHHDVFGSSHVAALIHNFEAGFAGTRTTHAVVQLSELLFGSVALMTTRVAFETMVSAYWLSLDPEARTKQFDRFGAEDECYQRRTSRPSAKTEAGIRVVELSPDLAESFVEHLDRYGYA